MTTEILRNTLFQKQLIKSNENIAKELLHFDMDTENDLAAVMLSMKYIILEINIVEEYGRKH